MADEIAAMQQIAQAMEGLEENEAQRVLAWAVSKWGNASAGGGALLGGGGERGGRAAGADGGSATQEFERIGDLMDAASPSTVAEYALVATYWFQELKGAEHVTGQQVNSELKDLGHGTTDITGAFDSLKNRKPPLARQVQKAGSTRQARKRYRLTQEGARYVKRMLSGEGGE